MSSDKLDYLVDHNSVEEELKSSLGNSSNYGKFLNVIRSPWGQVWIISIVCFCLPGMYNALSGMGGSGQVDPTVASNATVALLSVGAATGVFFAGPIVGWIGPTLSLFIGGWAYPLYSGALLNFNHHQNAAFVITAGALLGLGANFVWIPEGMIMTTYVKDEARGRAIALFWIVFNLGGGVGSLASLGINYHQAGGTVTDSTYIAYIVIMVFGWLLGSLLVCSPSKLNAKYKGERVAKVNKEQNKPFSLSKIVSVMKFTLKVATNWKVLCLIPMFFNANVFYSYQQNSVNGMTFDIRSRALNSALYWFAQMFGGFFIGFILDLKYFKRGTKVLIGWILLMVTGMVIWGGGLSFQIWNDKRLALGLKQDVDFTEKQAVGPIFLYIFYGMYDALWQGYCYWMIGTIANSPIEGGIIVGTYKTMQCVGGAMAWRVNALKVAPKNQLAMNWGLTCGTLIIALPCVINFLKNDAVSEPEKTESDILPAENILPAEDSKLVAESKS